MSDSDTKAMQTLLDQIFAKDAEIAELRKQRNEASVLHLRAMKERDESLANATRWCMLEAVAKHERDEARECVGMLYGIIRQLYMEGEIDQGPWIESLAATPEHLRK